jgi:hypothetical protein
MPRVAKRIGAEPLVEAIQSFASEWIDKNALSDFPGGVVRKGLLLRADHPIVKQYADQFRPARADIHEGKSVHDEPPYPLGPP